MSGFHLMLNEGKTIADGAFRYVSLSEESCWRGVVDYRTGV
jgi:hypothetical protein